MKRAILRIPQGTRFETLSAEQQEALGSVVAQFALPMPGTIAADGYELVDGITDDNFDPAVMPGLGLDWPMVGMWHWDERGDLDQLVALNDDVLLRHLPPQCTYDADGGVIATQPAVLHLPHQWAGWPQPDLSA